MADRDLVLDVKRAVESSANAWREIREEAEEDLLMIAGKKHWPEDVEAERRAQGRPCLRMNQLPQFLARVVGEYRLNQFEIKCKPADSFGDVRTAEIWEKMLRAIQHDSVAKVAYRTALQSSAGGGFGWIRVGREFERWDSFSQVVRFRPVPNPFSVYVSARSFLSDLSDATDVTVLDEIPIDEYKRRWPDASESDVEGGAGDHVEQWVDERAKTIRIAEHWRRTTKKRTLLLVGRQDLPQQWQTIVYPTDDEEASELRAQMAAAGVQVIQTREVDAPVLEQGLVSGADVLEPMAEQPGQYFPLVLVAGEEIVAAGKRYMWGVIRHAKDSARMVNVQMSAAVEGVALQPKAPYVLTPAQIEGFESYWQSANKSTTPYLLYNPDPQAPGAPRREAPPQIAEANVSLMREFQSAHRATTGIHEAALGMAKAGEKSGVALQEAKMTSEVATSAYPDNLQTAMEHAGRVALDLGPHVYTEPGRMVRILGEDLTQSELQRVNDLEAGLPDITRGRYDVVVTVGRSYSTRRAEGVTGLLDFAKTVLGPQNAVMIAPQIAGMLDIPGKDELVKKLEEVQQMAQQGGPGGQGGREIMQQVAQLLKQSIPSPEALQQFVRQAVADTLRGAGGAIQ